MSQEKYIGMDVHQATVSVAVMDSQGKLISDKLERGSIKVMARCRSMLASSLVALWMAIPTLACLPTSQITAAEMACCNKIAGDCHMGAAQHPCLQYC